MNAKEFLILTLDTPFSNPTLLNFLRGANHERPDSLGLVVECSRFWKHLPEPGATEWPVVCKNCRATLGIAKAEILLTDCCWCRPEGVATEAGKAVDRLLMAFREAGIKSIAPILTHLSETPLPTSSVAQLNKKCLAR